MDFTPKDWQDGAAGGTPITAAELDRIETGIEDAETAVEAAQATASAALPAGGTAASATKLATARNVRTNLASTAQASFDGTADITPGVTGTLPVANGGTGATTLTGLIKGNGAGAMSAAVAGTDYAPATSGSGVLKGNGSGGTTAAVAGTDFAPATSGSGVLKGNGSGGTTAAAAGTDYTSPSSSETQTNKKISAATNRVAGGLASLTAEFSLSNTTTETDVLSTTLPTGDLVAGATYRVRLHNTVLNLLASNTLTLKVYLGGVALSGSFAWNGALTNAAVWNEFLFTVRSVGASGTVMCNSVGTGSGNGSSAVTATNTVDTTTATPVLKVTAQFSAANASNNVKIELAVIERVM